MNWKFKFLLVFIISLSIFLRFYQLDKNPPSLYWEEVALGYDAYSIFKTGKDHHGNPWPLVAFESFGDWKPSLYFYATVPSIAVFGLNEWGVRFPSAFFGVLTVILTFLLVKELVGKRGGPKGRPIIALLSMFFLAISSC